MTKSRSEATLRMILARLSWPLRMIRWMAAREYGALLGSDRYGRQALSLYYDWLSTRRLETEVTSGLAVLVCAHGRDVPDFLDVTRSIQKPSILADVMLQFIYGFGWRKGGWENAHFGLVPEEFKPRKYFEEHNRADVPPIMSRHFGQLESETGFPFMQQWGYEWQRLTDELGAPHSGFPYHFIGSTLTRSGVIGQFSQAQCDVFRSAYLRTLALAVSVGAIPIRNAVFFALDNLPLNGDLLRLRPGKRPEWLADLPEQASLPEAPIEALARQIIAPRSSPRTVRPVSLHVPIEAKRFEFGELYISAVLATPDFVPDPSDEYYFARETLWALDDQFSFCGSLNVEDANQFKRSGNSGTVLPFCLGLMPMPFGFWHGEYMHQGMSLPASYNIPKSARVSCNDGGVLVESDGEVLSTLSVWHDHWTPLYPPKGDTRVGMVTDCLSSEISHAADRHEMKLGWVAQLRTWTREEHYGEFTTNERRVFFFDVAQ